MDQVTREMADALAADAMSYEPTDPNFKMEPQARIDRYFGMKAFYADAASTGDWWDLSDDQKEFWIVSTRNLRSRAIITDPEKEQESWMHK
jgi:hypothetical protein